MKIAIVNDMVMAVELLKRIIFSVPGYELAWVAYDGAEAVRRCAAHKPDLILMDLIMPVMSGVEATQRIMKNSPCAILLVTASVLGNISKVFEAMGHGALDVVQTPRMSTQSTTEDAKELLQKIETIQRLVGKSEGAKAPHHVEVPKSSLPVPKQEGQLPPLVTLGASTGGPLAIMRILSKFPSDFPASIVIVQHVDRHFADSFVRWLGAHCQLPVEIITNGYHLKKGVVGVASTNDHLVMDSNSQLSYTPNPKDNPCRPSIDVFFESLVHWPSKGIAALLTGMGRDGAKGLKVLKDADWCTLAQHKDDCVVYGMPQAAVELNAAKEVLGLDQIAQTILSTVSPSRPLAGMRG